MLPYERLWTQILNIHRYEVPFSMGNRKGDIAFETIMGEISDYQLNTWEFWIELSEIVANDGRAIDFSSRYKEFDSITRKWNKDDGTRQLYKVLNDTLGLRFVLPINKNELLAVAEAFIASCPIAGIARRHDLNNRQGYQGIHIYIRNGTRVFPIEVQLWTRRDALLNRYLRDTIYKRVEYEPFIQYASALRDWLEIIPMLNRDTGIQSYIDYMYEKAFSKGEGDDE